MYNTGNPLGSTAPKDFSDNSEITDRYVNDVFNETTQDRFGRSRLTLHGIEKKADAIFASVGFFVPVDYTTGLNVDSRNFTVTYNGVVYAAQPSAVPFTTGAWDAAQWYPIQNLLNQKNLLIFGTYAEASAAAATLPDGQVMEVSQDETSEGARTRYKVQVGALVFVDYLPDAISLESYADLDAYTGKSSLFFVTDTTVSGFFKVVTGTPPAIDGGIVRQLADGRVVRRIFEGPVFPEWWGASEAAADNTAALNAAFATGLTVRSEASFTVAGIVNTKGQAIEGGMKINSSRFALGAVPAKTEAPDADSLRMVYVESAYDLAELLAIKSLGVNTINHYCYFDASPADAAGTLEQLLKNAATAGIKVHLGTESARAQASLSEFVGVAEQYPATYGYSVYDEPWGRNISVATQDAKIESLRGLTKKPLSVVELMVSGGPFTKRLSDQYDIIFVDAYSLNRATGTLAEKIAADMQKFRLDFGCLKAMGKTNRVYPVISAFTTIPANLYSTDPNQIIPASSAFGVVGGGNFGVFVWDGIGDPTINDRMRTNASYRKLVKDLASTRVRKAVKTDAYLFGGSGVGATHWPLTDLIKSQPVKDPDGPAVTGNAYPVRLVTGASETGRTTTTANADYSGLAFKGTAGTYTTAISAGSKLSGVVEVFSPTYVISGGMSILTSRDGGNTYSTTVYSAAVNGNTSLTFGVDTPQDETISFQTSSSGGVGTLYRRFMRGLLVATNW